MKEHLPEFIGRQAQRLIDAGIEQAAAEIEWILCYLTGLDRLNLYLNGSTLINDDIIARFETIMQRRIAREPLQYILEESWFYGRKFFVSPAVMVPTPETELLCETALRYMRSCGHDNPTVLDIGVGSGVASVTIALEMPACRITAVDISEEALAVAEKNATDLKTPDNMDFRQSDFFSAIKADEKFDLIISNPPYIADCEYADLSPEVKADPKLSLLGGADGLDAVRAIIAKAPDHLLPGGQLMFEIGYLQGEKVCALTENDDRYKSIVVLKDLNDIDRVVILACRQ